MGDKPRLRYYLDPDAAARGVRFDAPRSGDAGFDLRAAEEGVLSPGSQTLVSTKLKVAIPLGWVGIVKDRSSMAMNRIYTHGGVIDAGYRGEVRLLISNQGNEPFHIKVGDKVAQLVVVAHLDEALHVDSEADLGSTERSDGGFGSTGRV